MKISEYLWFWKTSWSYMKGERIIFFKGIIGATINYRKAVINDLLKEKENGNYK